MNSDLQFIKNRTWAEIDLDALEHNIKILKKILNSNAKFLAVCKANAYGHGMINIAKKLQECNIDFLGVATVQEAIELRNNNITLPILCLGQADINLAKFICDYDITQTVADLDFAKALSSYALSVHKKIKVHIKIDTGMGRLGFLSPEPELRNLNGLELEGIFTHFADADDNHEYTILQLNKFKNILNYFKNLNLHFKFVHAAASSGVLKYPDSHFNMARFGLSLYGYASPDTGNNFSNINLKPVMTVKSRICAVRRLPKDSCISYGCTFKLKRDSVIAVLPIGYADGYPRALGNSAFVKIHDTLCPVIGRVCMDMIIIDITDINNIIKTGDIAIIYDSELLPQAAKKAQTIIDEIVCRVSNRINRIYLNNHAAI